MMRAVEIYWKTRRDIFVVFRYVARAMFAMREVERSASKHKWRNKWYLPFVFSCCLVEDIFLAIYGQDTVLHNTLPAYVSVHVLQRGIRKSEGVTIEDRCRCYSRLFRLPK